MFYVSLLTPLFCQASLSANIAAGALEVTVDHLTLKAGLEDYHLLPPLRCAPGLDLGAVRLSPRSRTALSTDLLKNVSNPNPLTSIQNSPNPNPIPNPNPNNKTPTQTATQTAPLG